MSSAMVATSYGLTALGSVLLLQLGLLALELFLQVLHAPFADRSGLPLPPSPLQDHRGVLEE